MWLATDWQRDLFRERRSPSNVHSNQLGSGKPDMRLRRNLAVLSHNRTLKDAGRCDQQLVGWIAMERLRQLGGFHHDLRMEVQKGHARFSKGALYPKPDCPIQLQPSVLHEFRDFPTRDDADAEDAVSAKFEKFAVPCLQPIRPRNPPDPNVVSSRITAGRPSPRWQQAPTAHGTQEPNLGGFGPQPSLILRFSTPPTLQPAGRARMEGPPKRVRHAHRL
jgi:hypothetical protein